MANPIFQGVSLYDSVGLGLLADSAQNLFVDLNAVAGTALGATGVAHFGTAPSAVNVPGVNSSIFAGTTGLTATGSSLNVNITGGGSGGTQYTDETNETAGAFTITVAGLYNGTQVVGLRGDASNNLFVDIKGHAGATLDAVLGAAVPPNALLVAGSDGTDLRALNVSPLGTQIVQDAVDAEAASINFFATNSAAAGTTVASGSYVPVISIRTQSSSKIYRLRGIDVMSLNGAASAFQLVRNPTLSGASFAASTSANMDVDTSATSFTSGTVVDAGFVAEQKARDKNIAIYIAAGAPGDILTLAFNPSSGSSVVAGAFQWSEQAAAL